MVLYMLAFMITSVVEEEFYIQKACLVHLNKSAAVCGNLSMYQETKKEVQIVTAKFHQWRTIFGQLVPILLTLFIGAWSDKWGRKLFLLVGLCGKLYFSAMMTLNAVYMHWPLENIIFTAIIPSSITGTDVAIFSSCYSYITDISSAKTRLARVSLLEGCYLWSIPIGITIGSSLFYNVVNRNFAIMWAINSSLLLIAFVEGCITLQFTTSPHHKSIKDVPFCDFCKDIFRLEYLFATFRIFHKVSADVLFNRRNVVLLFIAMGMYVFQRDEKAYLYMYTQLKFDWGISEFSFYKTMASVNFAVCMLFMSQVINRYFKVNDYLIMIIGTLAHISARVWYFCAQQTSFMYVGAAVCGLGPVVAPAIRSRLSKETEKQYHGRVFALLSIADNGMLLVSGICYSQIYRNTIEIGPMFLLLTIGTQIGVCCIAVFLNCNKPRK